MATREDWAEEDASLCGRSLISGPTERDHGAFALADLGLPTTSECSASAAARCLTSLAPHAMLIFNGCFSRRIGVFMRKDRSLSLAGVAVVLFSGCDRDPPTADPSRLTTETEMVGHQPQITWRDILVPAHSIDAVFLEINQAVPGFSGLVLADGSPTVLVTHEAAFEPARSLLSPLLEARQHPIGAAEVRVVEYEWWRLSMWRAELLDLLTREDVLWTDVNELSNRVEFGLVPGGDDASLLREVVARDVPSEAVIVTFVEPDLDGNASLFGRHRPPPGGLRINEPNSSQGPGGCTLGFNLVVNTAPMFMTASHCTDSVFSTSGTQFYQSTWGEAEHLVGVENWDPAPFHWEDQSFEGHVCDTAGGTWCRWSDAAQIAYEDSVPSAQGLLVRTESADRWEGSTVIADSFVIVGKEYTLVMGDTVHKVGATTGWTYGDVDQTCVHRSSGANPDVLILCQHRVSSGVSWGDSGAPVFVVSNGNEARLAGMLWRGEPMGTSEGARYVFAPIGNIEDDFSGSAFDVVPLPTLGTWIVGPSEVPPATTCTWQGFVDGGLSPYSFAWSGLLSGSGNHVSGSASQSGWLKLLVGSTDGQQATDSLFVQVTSSAEPCPE